MKVMKLETFIQLLFSILTAILSITAIIISIKTSSKQNKIALLNERLKAIEDIDKFINIINSNILDENQPMLSDLLSFSDIQIKTLFDNKVLDFYVLLKQYREFKLDILFNFDSRKGSDVDKDKKFMLEINNEYKRINNIFYKKYVKI